MAIPTYAQWIRDTSLNIFKPRSTQLKAVDDAIRNYEMHKDEASLWRIKNAFEDWKRYKGAQWEKSDRNSKRALTLLNTEMSKPGMDPRIYQITHMSMEELKALAVVAKERKKVLQNIFTGKKVTLKLWKTKEALVKSAEDLKENAGKAAEWLAAKKRAAPQTGRPVQDIVREKMEAMVKTYFGVAGLELLGDLSGLVLKILAQCSVSVAPVVGYVKDGYDLFTGWAKVGADIYEQYNISERRYVIDTDAPAAAFGALQSCLADETKNEAISATRATTAFALKTGLAFADGGAISGPVLGAASAIADVTQKLFLLGFEYRATKAVNVALEAGNLDISLFKTYPLMGCYLLVSGTLSDLIPIESFGTPGWTDYITHMKADAFDDIYESATGLIEKSPWEIIGLPKRPKGTTAGAFGEAKRIFSTVSPLADLKDLLGIKKTSA